MDLTHKDSRLRFRGASIAITVVNAFAEVVRQWLLTITRKVRCHEIKCLFHRAERGQTTKRFLSP